MLELNNIYNMDCLEGMDLMIEQRINVDAVITDIPYGTTTCKWDSVIPFDEMWKRLNKLRNKNTPILLFSRQPFTSNLIMSNPKMYKQEIIWLKTRPSNVFNAKKMFMNWHENIIVFYEKLPTYNPQMRDGEPYKKRHYLQERENGVYGQTGEKDGHATTNNGKYYPKSVIEISNPNQNSLHPTQKPTELIEYLIKTYTNEGDVVLDFTIGSGTTSIACMNTNRQFIGFELDKNYYNIAQNRIKEHKGTARQVSFLI